MMATWTMMTSGEVGAQQADEELIEQGRRLFMEETFEGNGRTCATCHPPTNNFTIDPAFIRALPANDPLCGPRQVGRVFCGKKGG